MTAYVTKRQVDISHSTILCEVELTRRITTTISPPPYHSHPLTLVINPYDDLSHPLTLVSNTFSH